MFNSGETETGFTIVEIMVATVIIIMILVATAQGIGATSKASIAAETRTKAAQLAAERLSVARALSYGNTVTYAMGSDYNDNFDSGTDTAKCSTQNVTDTSILWARDSGGTIIYVTPTTDITSDKGLFYCSPYQYSQKGNGIGVVFYIQTVVTNVTTVSSLGLSDSSVLTHIDTACYPKKVTVTVTWTDVTNDTTSTASSVVYNTYTESYIKIPQPYECEPSKLG